jgi:hypothetical protein
MIIFACFVGIYLTIGFLFGITAVIGIHQAEEIVKSHTCDKLEEAKESLAYQEKLATKVKNPKFFTFLTALVIWPWTFRYMGSGS